MKKKRNEKEYKFFLVIEDKSVVIENKMAKNLASKTAVNIISLQSHTVPPPNQSATTTTSTTTVSISKLKQPKQVTKEQAKM